MVISVRCDQLIAVRCESAIVGWSSSLQAAWEAVDLNIPLSKQFKIVCQEEDLLDLACTREGPLVTVDDARFAARLDERRGHLEREVQTRNSRYYDQQEELLYRNQQDRRAESEGKIREYKAKEREARKHARGTDDPMQQLKFKKEARKWAERAEQEDEEARAARKKMREEADRYLDLIEQSLKGTQAVEHLFSIRWKVVA